MSMVALGVLELELDFDELLLDEASDTWLEALELTDDTELTDGIELMVEFELLSALLLAVLSADDVCGLVFVVLLAVKPLLLLSPVPLPPPQALMSNTITAPSIQVNLEELMLIMRYYLLHAAAIDEKGLKRIDP